MEGSSVLAFLRPSLFQKLVEKLLRKTAFHIVAHWFQSSIRSNYFLYHEGYNSYHPWQHTTVKCVSTHSEHERQLMEFTDKSATASLRNFTENYLCYRNCKTREYASDVHCVDPNFTEAGHRLLCAKKKFQDTWTVRHAQFTERKKLLD